MTPAEFWAALDIALRELDAEGVPAMGPAGLYGGFADCASCTLTELEAHGVDTEGAFVFYTSDDYDPKRAECRLTWRGEETPLRLGARLAVHGLTWVAPADETARIRVFPA